VKLWPVRPVPPAGAGGGRTVPADAGPLAPGQLWAGRAGVFAGTATSPVELGDVQPPGKRRMAAAEWARGLHLDRVGAGQPPLAFS
jgi:methionyl-tRNA formyltransferase